MLQLAAFANVFNIKEGEALTSPIIEFFLQK